MLTEIERFIEKAQKAGAFITEINSDEQVVAYVRTLSEKHKKNGATARVAAPALPEVLHRKVSAECSTNGLAFIDSDVRRYSASLEIGLTTCEYGIAETGTIVLNCPSEDLRLTTMVCDYHLCVLKKSTIVANVGVIDSEMKAFFSNGADYTAFITGPSRTADIERVLTIGVHGPLELHILLVEDV